MFNVDDKGDDPMIIDDMNENEVEDLVVDENTSQKTLVAEKEAKYVNGRGKKVAPI